MTYIYIDESGDLGSKQGSSKYFVIAAIKVDDSKKLERIITKVRRYSKKKIFTNNELKGSVLPKYIKKKVFARLNSFHYEIFDIIFDKTKRTKNYIGSTNKELYDNLACE